MRALAWTLLLASLAACAAMQVTSPSAPTPATPGAIASVPIGRGPTLLAVSPDGATVYAASVGKLFAIRAATNTVAATARIDPYTTGLAVTPDGTRVLSIAASSSTLGVLPAATLSGATSIGLPQNLYPGGYGQMAVAADGRSAWIVNEALWVAAADLGVGTSRRIQLDLRPRDVAVSHDGRTVYLAGCKQYCTTGTIEVIDAASGNVRAAIDVGPAPYRLALSPDGHFAYTTNLGGPSLSVVDLSGVRPTVTLPVGTEPTGLAVSPDGARVYVAAKQSRTLTIVRGDGGAVLATVALSGLPRDVVLSPDGRRAYVSTSAPDTLVVLDTQRLGMGH
jgi:DNA-binding beta-propeller fold protein YncE